VTLDSTVIDLSTVGSSALSPGNNAAVMLSGTGTVIGDTVNLADGSILTVSVYDADHGAINVVSVATSPAIINGSGNINLANNRTLLEIPVEKGLILDENVILEGQGVSVANAAALVLVNGELVMKGGVIRDNHITAGDGWNSGWDVSIPTRHSPWREVKLRVIATL